MSKIVQASAFHQKRRVSDKKKEWRSPFLFFIKQCSPSGFKKRILHARYRFKPVTDQRQRATACYQSAYQ